MGIYVPVEIYQPMTNAHILWVMQWALSVSLEKLLTIRTFHSRDVPSLQITGY